MTFRVLWGSLILPSHYQVIKCIPGKCKILIGPMIYWQNFQLHSVNEVLHLGEKTKRLVTGNSNQRQLFLFLMGNMFFWSSNYH